MKVEHMKAFKKIFTAIIFAAALAACLGIAASADNDSEGSLSNFEDRYEYHNGLFADISDGYWYGKYVAKAYTLGLVCGRETGSFVPDGNVTLAEAAALAARVHSIYYTGQAHFVQGMPWYQVYVDYCTEKGIIDRQQRDWNAEASRLEFARILSGSLPGTALAAINDVPDGAIPDVAAEDDGAEEIYCLYRAGILTGADEEGSFRPEESIMRSAMSTILSRMAVQSMRVHFSMNGYTGPDLEERERADDSFFEDAAILGNSLVEGLRIYSKLTSLDYYSGTSMTVISASSQLDAMAQHSYGKVYIELGINDIGWPVETFIADYGKMLDRIRADQPEADIYIMAITPVSRSREASSSYFTKARVEMYNSALYELAKEKECYYLDCYTILQGPDGYLPEENTWDGVHLNVPQYSVWEECIRTHYAG